jgi:uncharacterized membrane protein HdeD (DUF308 family)
VVLGTATASVAIGLVAVLTFLILNPPVAAASFGSTLILEGLVLFLSEIADQQKVKNEK